MEFETHIGGWVFRV